MTVKYWDILDVDEFWDDVDSGFIRLEVHPEFPSLRIANYSTRAAFDNHFQVSNAVKIARGLIFDVVSGDVLARPFPKFFNYGQPGSPVLVGDMQVLATDKLDGSLGIIYERPDGHLSVSTRGSFTSDQALHATTTLLYKYGDWVEFWENAYDRLVCGMTPVVEIIYPENRIVCDYGSTDDLVLLGWIHQETGAYFGPHEGEWDGPRAEVLPYETFAQAMAAPDREGKEGMVLFAPEIADWVKLKQEDYVELHRIATGPTARRVYEAMVSGKTVAEIAAPLPDEFHDFVKEVADLISARVRWFEEDRVEEFDQIRDELMRKEGVTNVRKEFALMAKETAHPGMMFALLDNRDITEAVVKLFRPSAGWVPGNHQEKMNEFRLLHR